MPTDPTADFVMIQPHLTVAELEQLFDPMPVVMGLDQMCHRFAGRAWHRQSCVFKT